MKGLRWLWLLALWAPGIALGQATFFGPTAYTSFADSPWAGLGLSNFTLADFENDSTAVAGVTFSQTPTLSSSFGNGLVDSVDADDGLINGVANNGAGNYGQALWFGSSVTLTFIGATKPTHAGLVWTDGSGTVTLRAYGPGGALLGSVSGTSADGSFGGGAAEDRFYGVTFAEGISAIELVTSGANEIDHVQFGVIPEPGTGALLVVGGLAFWVGRRHRAKIRLGA